MPAESVTAGQFPDGQLADIRDEGAGQAAGGLAGQLRMLRLEPMTTPTLEPGDRTTSVVGRPSDGRSRTRRRRVYSCTFAVRLT